MNWLEWSLSLWFGLLMAISPCPLTANIAAISFISNQKKGPSHSFWSGFCYTLGRSSTYVVLALIISLGLVKSSTISLFLQKHMNEILGPFLILTGLVLLEWVGQNISFSLDTEKSRNKFINKGFGGSFLIGFIFALSFCPVSAGLFFGALVPLILKSRSLFTLPFLFGVGSALPVLFFSLLFVFSAQQVGKYFEKIKYFQFRLKKATGIFFVLIGIYYSLKYIYVF